MRLGGNGEGKQRRLEVIIVVESSVQLSPTLLSCYQQGLLNKTEIESDAKFEVPAQAAK